jgi:hypothetical protein
VYKVNRHQAGSVKSTGEGVDSAFYLEQHALRRDADRSVLCRQLPNHFGSGVWFCGDWILCLEGATDVNSASAAILALAISAQVLPGLNQWYRQHWAERFGEVVF